MRNAMTAGSKWLSALVLALVMGVAAVPAEAQIGMAASVYGGTMTSMEEGQEGGSLFGGELAIRGGDDFPIVFFAGYEGADVTRSGADFKVNSWTMGGRYFYIRDTDLGVGAYLGGEMVIFVSSPDIEDYGPLGWGAETGIEIGKGSIRGFGEARYRVFGEPVGEDSAFNINMDHVGLRVGLTFMTGT